ncbi:phage head-tail connector protein [Bacillus sp. AFS017336]|uniref:phage head-tail connector protein n=1 Tax=Bacillus sp. AFS017336 TaxID=2033489 RepID=UPI000BF0F56D|nr:phage head-tail connector protein [Bacillus sp. AFS017336]PEL12672.1 hypothetical protein CN601_06915 [Bacillus sp. AFS017336]
MISELVKILLGVSDSSKNAIINFYIESVTQKILNYCNITELPEELESIVVEKVVAIMKNLIASEGNGPVKKITRGDTVIEYGTSNSDSSGSVILDDVKSQLNKFRRVKFQ